MSLVCLGSRGDPHGWNARKASLSFCEDSISEVFLHLTRASMRTPERRGTFGLSLYNYMYMYS